MDNNKNTTVRAGLGFSSILTLIFITLKLLGKITWPWVWVLAPLWIDFCITVIILIFIALLLFKTK